MKLKYMFLIAVLFLLAFVLFYSLIIRKKIKEVSSYKPFNEIVNKNLQTKRKSILVISKSTFNKKYSFEILDAKQTFDLEDSPNINVEGLKIVDEIPIGTPLTIQNVEIQGGGVAGEINLFILGKISLDNTEYLFSYEWGYQRTINEQQRTIPLSDRVWSFERAIWQDNALKKEFKLPQL